MSEPKADLVPLPRNRREVLVWMFGFAVPLGLGGASKLTGLTLESAELTELRGVLIETKANLTYCSLDVESKKGEITRCRDRARNAALRSPTHADD
jgi:hypothetical protein